MSDEEQVVLKLLEDLENDMELQKENHFAAIVDDARFRKLLEICRTQRSIVYCAIFRHLLEKRRFTAALLLDLAIGGEMVEIVRPAIKTQGSMVSYNIKEYVDVIIAYGRKMHYLPEEES